jgi:crotonobetainyl-CoA:carnitine CoA-transferase CaiB-like acyl-CoA transferase
MSLEGVRVLGLSRLLAGQWCTQTLVDLGADVIKIECHGSGDDTRGCGPPCLPQTDGSGSAETAYDLDRPLNPALQRVASPLKLTATPVVAQHALPLLDKHTREVLSDVRGLSTAHIDALAQACVV